MDGFKEGMIDVNSLLTYSTNHVVLPVISLSGFTIMYLCSILHAILPVFKTLCTSGLARARGVLVPGVARDAKAALA